MPLAEPVVGLFTEEWNRFADAYGQLVGAEREAALQAYRRSKASPDGSTIIALPGWSEIIHVSAPYQPSATEAQEYYAAKRAKRAPDLPQFVTLELRRREQLKERIARDPTPSYAQAFGSILTAIDNVQDFMSTLSTAGRLSLWAGPRIMQSVLPGASAGTANALGTIAARQAAAATAAEFAATVAARAQAGNLVARLALNNPALYNVALREATETAAQQAFRLAFSRATLGLAGRLVGRFIPVLGWIILASDLLNLLSFLAMTATPLYALLCGGPSQAIAAGVPAALFKSALKRETWRAHNLNPFSRTARARRLLRAAGRLPTVSNLLEVAQTTDQLFGIGISLGGLVGLLNSLSFGLFEHAAGRSVEFRGGPDVARGSPGVTSPYTTADPELAKLLRGEVVPRFEPRRVFDPATRRMVQQAAVIAATAPAIQAVQDVFTEEEHVLVALAHREALALLRWASIPEALAETLPAAVDARWAPPFSVAADTVLWAQSTGRDLDAGRRWWFDGAPREATGRAYVEHHVARVPGALADFLAPRRAAPVAALYGAVVDETWQAAWMLAENDPDLFHMELTPDARLVSSFTEEGFILAPGNSEGPVWRWWLAARERLATTGRTSLGAAEWQALADHAGVTVIQLLPADASVPPIWNPETAAGLG
jgi:hypothetical protein